MSIVLSRYNIVKVLAIFIILLILASAFFILLNKKEAEVSKIADLSKFVEEKISQSGLIKINPPKGISLEYARQNISFNPPIKGQWLDIDNKSSSFLFTKAIAQDNSNVSGAIIFKPNEKLELNKHYAVSLKLPDQSEIKGEFLSVEDPKIEAVFPSDRSETSEYSEITIVFNRPMVPLTALDEFKNPNIPVEILPKTEGRFKWTSTRNLQFIPKNRLIRSSNYIVKIKDGLVSMDGLPVKGAQSSFISKPLRMTGEKYSGSLTYNAPFILSFNQPIDLEKTKKEIKVLDSSSQKEIPFIVQHPPLQKFQKDYAKKSLFDNIFASAGQLLGLSPQTEEERLNDKRQSVLYIYPAQDSFARPRLWDFDKSYEIRVSKFYPKEGDINLDGGNYGFYVFKVIDSITADSSRAKDYVYPDFFDPQGKLIVRFFEEIDIGKSAIKSQKPVKNIYYEKKCSNEEETRDINSPSCQKIDDKKTISIEFFEKDFSLGESFKIIFEKIINAEGLNVNTSPIEETITTYPKFEIFSTTPSNNSIDASLTEFIICSSTPLVVPPKEDYGKLIKGSPEYQIKDWNRSHRIYYELEEDKPCKSDQFNTQIRYGLMPLENYKFNFDLTDVFGQKQELNTALKTSNIDAQKLSFYHLQKYYNVTTPQKSALTFASKNMEFIDVEICKQEPRQFLKYVQSAIENDRYDHGDIRIIDSCSQKVTKRIFLGRKYWINNYFKVDIKDYFSEPLGHYILTFSHPNYKKEKELWDDNLQKYVKYKAFERSYLTITNLAVAAKQIDYNLFDLKENELAQLKNLYWVSSISDQENLSNAAIELYGLDGLVNTIYTDSNGIALTESINNIYAAIVKYQNDSTLSFSDGSDLNWTSRFYKTKKNYIYSDKPIYQPGQTVNIKGIYRIGFETQYDFIPGKTINLDVVDPRGNKILSRDLSLNNFGTFSAEFILDKKSPLGSYRVCVEDYNCGYFDVEEYVGAPFEVKLKTDKEEYLSGDNLRLSVDANYYFGLPLDSGKIEYTFSSQNYYFDKLKNEFYYFGNNTYDFRDEDYYYGDRFLFRSSGNLDDSGKALFDKKLSLEELIKNRDARQSKIIVADVSVQNQQGQTVSAQKSFVLHQGKFYLGLLPDKTFLGKKEPLEVKIKSVDIQGKNVSVGNADLVLNKIEWLYAKRQEADGGYSYKTEKKKTEINRYNFSTDTSGNYILKGVQFSSEGEYELEVIAKDDLNNEIWSRLSIYVYGENQASVRPSTDTTLELEVKNTKLNVGDKGEIIIKSPFSQSRALIAIERGKIFNYEIIDLKGNINRFTFDALEDYYPNVFVSVLLHSKTPEVKFNSVKFTINSDSKKLNIDVKSDKTYYLPGEKVALDLSVKDSSGRPTEAEVSVAVVDLSILALKGNPKKNPLVFFYGGLPLTVQTFSNLKNILTPIEIIEPDELNETKGGGGGDLSKKPRGDFRETAFWRADVVTDKNGKAQIEFTLPDNLTTWQVESLGVTKDTKLGIAYTEFISKKDLMIVPLKPRFVVPGDEFYIGAKIFNQTKAIQRFKTTLSSDTLILQESSLQETTIAADKTDAVYFKVKAPEKITNGVHFFTLKTIGGSSEDSVIERINITPNNTYETVATSYYSNRSLEREYVFIPEYVLQDKGELTISSSATLAVFLSPALNYLINFPYECLEQVASNLSAIVKVKKALNLPNIKEKFQLKLIKYQDKDYSIDEIIEISLAKLLANQDYNGGFPFWRGELSNFNATLTVFEALLDLRSAGYYIDSNVLLRAAQFVYNEYNHKDYLRQNPNTTIILSYLLSRLSEFKQSETLKQNVFAFLSNDLLIKERLSNQALSYLSLALINWNAPALYRQKVNQILDNRVKIDSRGAFIDVNNNHLWYYFETPIKNTALYLKTLAARQYDSPIIDKVLRWLLSSRDKDGAWGSTNNTLFVIDALTDYIAWKKETQSDFDLKVSLNSNQIQSLSFNPANIFDQHKKELPLKDFEVNKNNIIEFQKQNKNNLENRFYYDIALKYYLSAKYIASRDEGFSIERNYFALSDKENKKPILKAKVGDILRVNLKITTGKSRNYVSLEDFIPAGAEIVNLDLATEQKSLRLLEKENFGRHFYPSFKEIRNDRAYFFVNNLGPGNYEVEYFIRALTKGKFLVLPAMANETYFPENFGRTKAQFFEIE